MRNRTKFILLYSAVFIFFLVPYVIHLINVAKVATQITYMENSQLERFNNKKNLIETAFKKEYPEQDYQFTNLYSIQKATIYHDTVLTFFIYSNTLKFKSIDMEYLACLNSKAESEAIKSQANKTVEKELSQLEKKHSNLVREWAEKIGKKRFLDYIYLNGCGSYFSDNNYYTADKDAFIDFDRFLTEYKNREIQVQEESTLVDEIYQEELARIKQNLSENEKQKLDQQLSNNPVLKDGNKSFSFSGSNLGQFEYTIPSPVIDMDKLEDALQIVYTEHYKDNSLKNGAMPYAYCYGGSNTGNSSVRVNAGNSDVLLMIKNTSGKVVRHVYVQADKSYTLYVPNGYYSVHFYYGTGWNPKKHMTETNCGELIGGFIYYEVISKDPETMSLFNDHYTYTLQSNVGGNFNTVPSSKNEAF